MRREKPSAKRSSSDAAASALAGRERPDAADPLAVTLDEPVADRHGREERDLLGRDRADEHLEGIRRERGPEAGEADDERRDRLLVCSPRREGDEVELEAEQLADDRLRLGIERLDVDAAVRRRDPQLPPADGAIERAVLPDRGPVEPEGAKPRGRQLEGERLRSLEKQF